MLTSRAHALSIIDATPAVNDRFAGGGTSFIGSGFDFSGVGRVSDGRSATRIGANYFISANHLHPEIGFTVRYEATNTSGENRFEYIVRGGVQVGNTDLWIGWFDEELDSSIATYAISTTAATNLAQTGLSGQDLFMVGAYNGSLGVGRNRAEGFANDASSMVLPTTFDQVQLIQNQPGDVIGSFITGEAFLESGDSGSPLFSVSGGNLIVQGTASLIATSGSADFDGNPSTAPDTRPISIYNYIGSYGSEIDTALLSVPAPVPEPSTALLASLSALCLFRRTR